MDKCFWNNIYNSKLQWQVKQFSNTPFHNALVANISDPVFIAASIGKVSASFEGPITYNSEHLCFIRISYSFAPSQSALKLRFWNNSKLVPISVQPSLSKLSVEYFVQYGFRVTLLLKLNGPKMLDHLLYTVCSIFVAIVSPSVAYIISLSIVSFILDLSFESMSKWHDVSPSQHSNWSIIHVSENNTSLMPPVDHTYGEHQAGTYALATGVSGFDAVGTVGTMLWSNVCGLRFWYFVSEGVARLEFHVYNTSGVLVTTFDEKVSGVTERWLFAEMAVGYDLFGSEIEVVASSANGNSFSVAVDDIEFTECAGKKNYREIMAT